MSSCERNAQVIEETIDRIVNRFKDNSGRACQTVRVRYTKDGAFDEAEDSFFHLFVELNTFFDALHIEHDIRTTENLMSIKTLCVKYTIYGRAFEKIYPYSKEPTIVRDSEDFF